MADQRSGAQRLHPPSGGSSILDVLNSVGNTFGSGVDTFRDQFNAGFSPSGVQASAQANPSLAANLGLALGGAGVFGGGQDLAKILLAS